MQSKTIATEKTSSPMATTTEPKSSLKIQTVITETKSIEKEISLPYYFQINSYYYAVLNKDSMILVDPQDEWYSIQTKPVRHYLDDIAKGVEITAEEFEEALQTAYSNLPKSIL